MIATATTPMATAHSPAPGVATSPAPASSPPPAIAVPPPGWAPRTLDAVPGVRAHGLLPAALDAFRGVNELGNGQRLSAVQVATLSPFLAGAYRINPITAANDLGKVRIYTGGPAAGQPGLAVTLGRDIYVDGEGDLKSMFNWKQRTWLVHELGHTMQWRRIDEHRAPDDLARTRRSLLAYAGGMVVDGHRGPGAIPRGLALWVRENIDPRNKGKSHISLPNAVHDSHPLEIEAEANARRFGLLTGSAVPVRQG